MENWNVKLSQNWQFLTLKSAWKIHVVKSTQTTDISPIELKNQLDKGVKKLAWKRKNDRKVHDFVLKSTNPPAKGAEYKLGPHRIKFQRVGSHPGYTSHDFNWNSFPWWGQQNFWWGQQNFCFQNLTKHPKSNWYTQT